MSSEKQIDFIEVERILGGILSKITLESVRVGEVFMIRSGVLEEYILGLYEDLNNKKES